MGNVREALRHALRRLVRRPGLTAAIVLILAVGIGVSTAVFSVVRRVLVRPIPVAELDRLVVAWEIDPSREGSLIEVSFPYFQDWRAQNRSFEDMAAYGSVNWSHEFKGHPRARRCPRPMCPLRSSIRCGRGRSSAVRSCRTRTSRGPDASSC